MDPKVQQLRAFYYAYRLRSLTKAGEKLHLTQSAMSRLTQQLEEVLGLRLFDRATGFLQSTEAAEEAILIVERILGDVDYLKTSLKGLAEKRRGHVSFAITPMLAANVAPSVLTEFETLWSNLDVSIMDAPPDRLLELVLNEAVQFGISTLGERRSDLEYSVLHPDHLCLICRPDSIFARRGTATWSDLRHERVIAMTGGSGWPDILRQGLPDGEEIHPRYRASYSSTALAMTAKGLGVTIMPSFMIYGHPNDTGLVAIRLMEPLVNRDLYVVTKSRRSLSPGAKALVELYRELLLQLTSTST
jgi:LysR family carnitine catabolism transcriptional activator